MYIYISELETNIKANVKLFVYNTCLVSIISYLLETEITKNLNRENNQFYGSS